MTTDQYIGDRVHQLMWRKKLKQTKVAPELGLSQSGLGRKIRGERSWSLEELLTIAKVLEVSVSDLLPPDLREQLLTSVETARGELAGNLATGVTTAGYPAASSPACRVFALVSDPRPPYPSVAFSNGSCAGPAGYGLGPVGGSSTRGVNDANAA